MQAAPASKKKKAVSVSKEEEKWEIERIIGKRVQNGELQYEVEEMISEVMQRNTSMYIFKIFQSFPGGH